MNITDFSPNPEAPVLVIGAAGVDLVGRLQSDLKLGTSNPASIRTTYGGVARNVAENLARLGQPVTLLTAIGDDEPGTQLLKQVSAAGVDTSRVMCCQDQNTGSYLAVIDQAAELAFALDDMRVIRSITSDYLKEHLDVFKGASLLFLDMNLDPKTLRTAVSLGRKHRLPIFADPTSVGLSKRLLPYLDRLEFLTPNSKEAEVLCGMQVDPANRAHALEAASCLVSKGVKIVVLTLSEFGLCYASPEARGYIPAMATEIIDPTGAGDALTAAVIVGMLDGIPLDEAMRLGVAAASLTLRYRGAVRPDLSLEILYEHLVI